MGPRKLKSGLLSLDPGRSYESNKPMPCRIGSIVLAFLAMSAGVSSAQTEPQSSAGVEGVITISPYRPGPTRAGLPDSAPLAKQTFAVDNGKGVVTSLTTDEQGRFRVSLHPGHYVVSLQNRKTSIGRFGPWEVEVVAGKVTTVEWQCDSGMR